MGLFAVNYTYRTWQQRKILRYNDSPESENLLGPAMSHEEVKVQDQKSKSVVRTFEDQHKHHGEKQLLSARSGSADRTRAYCSHHQSVCGHFGSVTRVGGEAEL